MIKLWKLWCKKVDEHNKNITYVNHEEAWDYYTIFYPFLFGILFSIFMVFAYIIKGVEISQIINLIIKCFIISTLLFGFLLYLNWKANE